jgi:DNA polymerase-4
MFLCADLDAFFVSVEQVLNPSLIGKPVVVGGRPDQRGVVSSASYEARKFGIRSGMPTAQAYRLCPHACFVGGNFGQYTLYSRKFCDILHTFSPDVTMASIDEAYLDIHGTERLLGAPLDLAQKLKKEVHEKLHLPLSIGIARTKVFSKIACDQSKPDGLLMVTEDKEIPFLSPLSVRVLPGIGPKHMDVLKNLNIITVQELLDAPEWVLSTALGNYARVLQFMINGGDFSSHDHMKSISRETTLAEDTLDRDLIYALFLHLIERGCTTLREKKLLAKTLTVKIRYSDFKTVSKRTTIPTVNAQQIIFEQGIPVLDSLLAEKKRIRLIGIALSNLRHDGLQPSLFAVQMNRLNRLNAALDNVRNKFGFSSLSPAQVFSIKDRKRNDYHHESGKF